jgi:uncharacterized protein YodC (DUF2158 family)
MAEFVEGDVVVLKSRGPRMTVSNVGEQYGAQKAWCVWFEKTKKFEDTFEPEVLKNAEASGPMFGTVSRG